MILLAPDDDYIKAQLPTGLVAGSRTHLEIDAMHASQ